MAGPSALSEAEVAADCLRSLNRLLIQALKALRDRGEGDLACCIAADAWSAIRKASASEAEKLTGALHYLTRPIN